MRGRNEVTEKKRRRAFFQLNQSLGNSSLSSAAFAIVPLQHAYMMRFNGSIHNCVRMSKCLWPQGTKTGMRLLSVLHIVQVYNMPSFCCKVPISPTVMLNGNIEAYWQTLIMWFHTPENENWTNMLKNHSFYMKQTAFTEFSEYGFSLVDYVTCVSLWE